MLTGIRCKFSIIKAVQGKIHNFKTWYKRDLEITCEEQEEAAARSLAELASKVSEGEQDDGFQEDQTDIDRGMLYKRIASTLILVCYLFNIEADKELFSL